MMYQPDQKLLDNYADILIKFALNNCKGINKGDVVLIQVPEVAKPMLVALRRSVLKAGGHPITQFIADDIAREYYELASDEQLDFFPELYAKGKIDQIDHSVYIIAETNPKELEGIPPEKIMRARKAMKPAMDWREEKENKGKFTWTLAMWGTQQMADEVNMSLEDYWQEIIKACFLDEQDPIQKWKDTMQEIDRIKDKLNQMDIIDLHVQADNTDIHVGIDNNRQWLGGSGRNIPSFEIFISPEWTKTNGHIQFTEPLYRYGNLIENVYLEFKDGKVTKATATKGEQVLKEMIAQENADKAGEFSLTDARFSKITKFMGETLFDENVGGEQGNTHIAVGSAYKDSYPGDPSKITKDQWKEMGYNESIVHTDIVATSKRTVTATLKDQTKLIIYQDGQFKV